MGLSSLLSLGAEAYGIAGHSIAIHLEDSDRLSGSSFQLVISEVSSGTPLSRRPDSRIQNFGVDK
jgi:hypothetical protein